MSHVVMQAATFPTKGAAQRCERALRKLRTECIRFERNDPDPWSTERAAPPLVAFGERHGVDWPAKASTSFRVEGGIEASRILRVERTVFFWAPGLALGGRALQDVLVALGAIEVASDCHLVIHAEDATEHATELATHLIEEGLYEQFGLDTGEEYVEGLLFSITVVDETTRKRLTFDSSGTQDWAFVQLLPDLTGSDPTLTPSLVS